MRHLIRLCVALLLLTPAGAPAQQIAVDCSRTTGTIRPLNGVNCGPLDYGGLIDLSAYFREAAFPSVRLHDCHWPNPDVVDIHTVFPNAGADPANPASYGFARTDDYLQAIANLNADIVYRLGESIEHTRKKYHVHPPADPQRWAAICLGIIRHYNDGWASGKRLGIRYWEIWNEPENRPAMWTGTDEDYFRLYAAASRAIRSAYPQLKVGGPSLGYTGRFVNGRFEPGEFLLKFLDRCRRDRLPLDFFSWHLYTTNPAECMARAKAIRALLDERGFQATELHFNEWNYLPDNDWTGVTLQGQGLPRQKFFERMGGPEGTAFDAAVLINLQDTAVDVANHYSAAPHGFGLFTPDGVPKQAFSAFRAFRMLLETPDRLQVAGADPAHLAACAGSNAARSAIGILVSRYDAPGDTLQIDLRELPWAPARCHIWRIDGGSNLDKPVEVKLAPGAHAITLTGRAPSVWLIRLER